MLSRTLPRKPQIVRLTARYFFSVHPHPAPPGPLPTWQNGVKTSALITTINEPINPANSPHKVTPPFVPLGTRRKVNDVMRRGSCVDRIPSSDENVSAATAA